MAKTLALALAFCVVTLGCAAQSMTLPAGFLNTPAPGGGTSFPQNTTSDHIWQWHYDNPNFAAEGVFTPIIINEIYVRATSPGATVNAFDFPSFEVTLVEASTDYQVGSHDPVFANNVLRSEVVRAGPWVGGPVPPSTGATATWVPMGITGRFIFDPRTGNDFIIQIEKCGTNTTWGTTMDGSSGSPGANGGNRYGDTSSCTATMSSFNNNEFVPVVRIDYSLPKWHTNSPEASLDHNGDETDGRQVADTTVTTGNLITATATSSIPGTIRDVGFTFASALSRTEPGSLSLLDGSCWHVQGAPTWFFADVLGQPGTVDVVLPFPAPGAPVRWTSQMWALNPASPTFVSLSQGAQVTSVIGAVAGPAGDDSSVTVSLGAPPFTIPSVTFFGTVYSEFHVASNGRVVFGSPDTDFSPTAAEGLTDDPFCGLWSDFNPFLNGTITITQPTFSIMSVQFRGLSYFGESDSRSAFDIRFNAGTGDVVLDSLDCVQPNPQLGSTFSSGDAQFLGITMGNMGATDGGPTIFAPGATSGPPGVATDMIYDFWDGVSPGPNGVGLCDSLQTGLRSIRFVPAGGSYGWMGL